MNPSSSSASPTTTAQSLLESVAAVRAAGNERGLDAFLARTELAKVGVQTSYSTHTLYHVSIACG